MGLSGFPMAAPNNVSNNFKKNNINPEDQRRCELMVYLPKETNFALLPVYTGDGPSLLSIPLQIPPFM